MLAVSARAELLLEVMRLEEAEMVMIGSGAGMGLCVLAPDLEAVDVAASGRVGDTGE